MQWPKKRDNNTTQKTKDRATRTALNFDCELMCSGRVGSSRSTCGTYLVALATNGTYMWPFVTQIFRNG